MGTHSKTSVELFTPDELAIMAQWLGVEPPASARGINVEEVIARFGFTEELDYGAMLDLAVVHIVSKNIGARRPHWAGLRGEELFLAGPYRDLPNELDRRIPMTRAPDWGPYDDTIDDVSPKLE